MSLQILNLNNPIPPILFEIWGHGFRYEDSADLIEKEGYYIPKDQFEAIMQIISIEANLSVGTRSNERSYAVLQKPTTKKCPNPNCTDRTTMVPLSSTNTKICANCCTEIPWPLEEGQKSTFNTQPDPEVISKTSA